MVNGMENEILVVTSIEKLTLRELRLLRRDRNGKIVGKCYLPFINLVKLLKKSWLKSLWLFNFEEEGLLHV